MVSIKLPKILILLKHAHVCNKPIIVCDKISERSANVIWKSLKYFDSIPNIIGKKLQTKSILKENYLNTSRAHPEFVFVVLWNIRSYRKTVQID